MKERIIHGENAHIVIIVDTHLNENRTVNIEGYKCIPHNRRLCHIRAKVTFGGVCVLIKHCFLVDYRFDTIDKTYEGIMVVKCMHKYSEYSSLLVAGYLPPEGSAWGRDAIGFYAHILRTVYLYNSECDAIYLSGDLNSRFGLDLDLIPGIDDICNRNVIDQSKTNMELNS